MKGRFPSLKKLHTTLIPALSHLSPFPKCERAGEESKTSASWWGRDVWLLSRLPENRGYWNSYFPGTALKKAVGYVSCWTLKIRYRVSFPSPLTFSSLRILEKMSPCAKAKAECKHSPPATWEGLKQGRLCTQARGEPCRQAASPPSSQLCCGALGRGCRLGKAVTWRSRREEDGGMKPSLKLSCQSAAGNRATDSGSVFSTFFCNGMHIVLCQGTDHPSDEGKIIFQYFLQRFLLKFSGALCLDLQIYNI